MLRVKKKIVEKFGEFELAALLNSGGWRAVLPSALRDEQLLCTADQLRTLIAGKGWDNEEGQRSPALALSIALFLEACPERLNRVEEADLDIVMLHEVMTVISVTVDQEIVNRMLNRRDDQTGTALIDTIKELNRRSKMQANNSADEKPVLR